MNEKMIQGNTMGKYLLADMVGIVAGNRSCIETDSGNECIFFTPIGDTFIYGIQEVDSCVLSVLTEDAKTLYNTLVELGITEFESEIEVKAGAFTGENMLHVSFEL